MESNSSLTNMDFEDYVWFSKGALVLLLRAGFVLIQISSVPNNNVSKLVFQNLADIAISTALFMCVGYTLAFGKDIAGIVGIPEWIPVQEMHFDMVVSGWSTVIVSGAIFTSALAGKISVVGQLMSSAVFAGVVQPLVLHWVNSGTGWLKEYRDECGVATTHVSGGIAAFIGTVFMGRRLLLLRELDECSLPASSPGNIFTGYTLVIVGLLTMSHPRISILNNVAAAGGGALAIAVLQKAMGSNHLDYWKVVMCFQGAVAGVVTVATGLDLFHPTLALALGTFGAMISHITTRLCNLCFLEDYLNLVSVHLMCGIMGSLFSPVYSPDYTRGDIGRELYWQVLGVGAIVGLTTAVLVPLFFFMTCCSILRDDTETRNYLRARRNACSNKPFFWLGRILRPHRNLPQLRPGCRSKDIGSFLDTISEEPATGSEVSDIQGAGEPNERVQIPEGNVKRLNDSITNKNQRAAFSDYALHMVIFGREPSSRPENCASLQLQDSFAEVVECGTSDNCCASQRLHQVCYLNKDETYPPTISSYKLYNSALQTPDRQPTIILQEKDTTSRQTTKQPSDSQNQLSPLLEEKSKQDMEQYITEHFDKTLHLTRTNTEDEILKETPVKCDSEVSSDANRDTYLTEPNPLPNVVDCEVNSEDNFSQIQNTTDVVHTTLTAPQNQRCTSEQNLSTSFLSSTTDPKRKEKSESNLTDEKSISMKNQLQDTAGDINGAKTLKQNQKFQNKTSE